MSNGHGEEEASGSKIPSIVETKITEEEQVVNDSTHSPPDMMM